MSPTGPNKRDTSAPVSIPPLSEVAARREWKPALRSIPMRSWPTVFRCMLAAATVLVTYQALIWMNGQFQLALVVDATWVGVRNFIVAVVVGIAVAKLVYEGLLWRSRVYVIDETHARATSGVIAQRTTLVQLADIKQIVVDRSAAERALGLGTVLLSSAGSQRIDVAFINIKRSGEVADIVRAAIAKARPMPTYLEDAVASPRAIVIGLVGGIGSGKSTVAQALADLGCIVIDSDRQAKEALDLPRVRDELVRWWGNVILAPTGKVDRKAVANIVFTDATQRSRLESLVHPIVKSTRAELIGRATIEGKPGVVVDAPLLFEAGSDKECDAVIFVDCPFEQRLTRIATRGWDRAELERREKAQIPLEEKKRRATVVVVNDGTLDELRVRVKHAFDQLRERA